MQAIVAGHTHGTVAHFVNDVPIISVGNFGAQFGRMDLTFDTARRAVVDVRIHEPQRVCARVEPRSGDCTVAPAGVAADYEGKPVTPSAAVAAAIEPELKRVRALRAEPLGVVADAAFPRGSGLDGELGNLFAEALLAVVPGRRCRARLRLRPRRPARGLSEGPLTFGHAYDAFPFDNRITRVDADRRAAETADRRAASAMGRRTARIAGARRPARHDRLHGRAKRACA